jgi:hypothetical protein
MRSLMGLIKECRAPMMTIAPPTVIPPLLRLSTHRTMAFATSSGG